MSDSRPQNGAPAPSQDHPPGKGFRFAALAGMILGATAATLAVIGLSKWSRWSPDAVQTVLLSTLPGVLIGFAIGAVVWLARPRHELRVVRLVITRGLMGAGTAVCTLVLIGAVFGLVHGILPPFGPGDPGVESALTGAILVIVLTALPAGLLGFLVGGSVAMLIRGRRSTS